MPTDSDLRFQLPVAFEHVCLSPAEEEEGSENDVTQGEVIAGAGNKSSIRLWSSLIENGATELSNLLDVQRKGWKAESIDRHFAKQHKSTDNDPQKLSRAWFCRMRKLLGEIDSSLRCIPLDKVHFLDLGCSSGGFSSYILSKNWRSTGCGVSLPIEEGGHEFLMSNPSERYRYTLFSGNITKYALAPAALNDPRFSPLPDAIDYPNKFNIVLLDAYQLRTQTERLRSERDRLLISQLIIALKSVQPGGTIIMKLAIPHRILPAKIVYMFKMISGEVQRWKPRTMHENRGKFYLVARDVGGSEETGLNQATFLRALRRVWTELTFGSKNGYGRILKTKDLDFVVTNRELAGDHIKWLVEFGNPLWEVQEACLREHFEKKGILS
ncbi:hypothetical protein CPC08DRAFT_770899 [Agrocybe pediades]|nr:hypothetical protein CPC08DRAFT_770899 [Agrocybe pediades]